MVDDAERISLDRAELEAKRDLIRTLEDDVKVLEKRLKDDRDRKIRAATVRCRYWIEWKPGGATGRMSSDRVYVDNELFWISREVMNRDELLAVGWHKDNCQDGGMHYVYVPQIQMFTHTLFGGLHIMPTEAWNMREGITTQMILTETIRVLGMIASAVESYEWIGSTEKHEITDIVGTHAYIEGKCSRERNDR